MAGELSKVLDHIEKIRELDLEGVPPTSHVVDVVNVLQRGRAAPIAAGRGCAGVRPGAARGRLRRPEPGRGVSELIELSATAAAAAVRGGQVSAAELFEAYRERAAGR